MDTFVLMKKQFLLLISLSIVSCLYAQIPNASFGIWDTIGNYTVPQGWDNMNPSTANLSIYTCTAGTPGTIGATFLKLTTHSIASMGVVPGIASPGVLNKYDVNHPLPQSGFPYAQRPNYFSGMWQYMAAGRDQGYVEVLLSKWDSVNHKRDTVASLSEKLPGMVMLWQPFSIPLQYISAAYPDSAIIVLSASNLAPVSGSILYVDQLAFTDTAMNTGINDISIASQIEVYPNPASTQLTVRTSSAILSAQLYDLTGRMIYEVPGTDSDRLSFQIDALSKGSYMLRLQTTTGSYSKMVMIEY